MKKIFLFLAVSAILISCNNGSDPTPVTPDDPSNYMAITVNPSTNKTIALQIKGSSVIVDWGDGSTNTYTSTNSTGDLYDHTYTSSESKIITIRTYKLTSLIIPSLLIDITNISISNAPELVNLSVVNQQSITSMDVSEAVKLKTLTLSNLGLVSLSFGSNNNILEELNCDQNGLLSIDLSKLTSLKTINISNNGLGTLNLSNNTLITSVLCDNNNLQSLDLSKNKSLNTLVCRFNDLSTLDLSQNKYLFILVCSDNFITNLTIPQTKTLLQLYCNNNLLQSAGLDAIYANIETGKSNINFININENPGTNDTYIQKFTDKSWTVVTTDFILE